MTKEELQKTLENEGEKLIALYKASLELRNKIETLQGKLLLLQDEMADLSNDISVELEQLNK